MASFTHLAKWAISRDGNRALPLLLLSLALGGVAKSEMFLKSAVLLVASDNLLSELRRSNNFLQIVLPASCAEK